LPPRPSSRARRREPCGATPAHELRDRLIVCLSRYLVNYQQANFDDGESFLECRKDDWGAAHKVLAAFDVRHFTRDPLSLLHLVLGASLSSCARGELSLAA
jgi:hypothetical protein